MFKRIWYLTRNKASVYDIENIREDYRKNL